MIETTIDPVLSDAAATVAPELPVSEGAQQLRDPTVPALVVLDDSDRVTGIVTESDLAALVAEPHDCASVSVGDVMSTPVVTIPPETPLGLAADRMNEAGVKHLPVVEDGTYVGIVSLETMMPFLSRSRLQVAWNGEPTRVDTNSSSETADTESVT